MVVCVHCFSSTKMNPCISPKFSMIIFLVIILKVYFIELFPGGGLLVTNSFYAKLVLIIVGVGCSRVSMN